MNRSIILSRRLGSRSLAPAILAASLLTGCTTPPAGSYAESFATPEEAVQMLVVACKNPDAATAMLGLGGFELLRSGDDVADRQDLEAVSALIEQGVEFEDVGEGCKIARLGDVGWELPLPLVLEEGRWRFDVEAGQEEILNRRVGRNELSSIATLRAIVEAQREYSAQGRAPHGAYAQRFFSSVGSKDGLHWPTADGEEPSPLGPMVAVAAHDGYQLQGRAQPEPYHGYLFRILRAQGEHAPGGARSYLDEQGQLSGGFAVFAWPATHGNSGVMSFLVSDRGILFEKDLGAQTQDLASQIGAYDPDPSWEPVVD